MRPLSLAPPRPAHVQAPRQQCHGGRTAAHARGPPEWAQPPRPDSSAPMWRGWGLRLDRRAPELPGKSGGLPGQGSLSWALHRQRLFQVVGVPGARCRAALGPRGACFWVRSVAGGGSEGPGGAGPLVAWERGDLSVRSLAQQCPCSLSPHCPAACRRHLLASHSSGSSGWAGCAAAVGVPDPAPATSLPRATRAGPWPVRRTGWPTCMASSAGATAVGAASQASTPAWPTMWTGSMTGYGLPSGLRLPPKAQGRPSFPTAT